jgi:hypothetical protein
LPTISRLFSSSVFREMAAKSRSALFAKLFKESTLAESCASLKRVGDAFEAAFDILRTIGFRDEYIYKTALTRKVLLGTHSLRTASMMTEFRVEDCKADLVILNGTATVYEIKSERDSLTRLEKQIEAYKKVFASVVVIAGENHVDSVLDSTSSDVGVMQLSKRYQISILRNARERPDRICPIAVFETLRTNEAKMILEQLGVSVPAVPNTVLRSELRERFRTLEPKVLHWEMVKTLKRTRDLMPLAGLVRRLPPSLHAAALSISVRKSAHERLFCAVNTPLRDALRWA